MRIITIRRKAMKTYRTVSDVSRRLSVRPRDISDLFYQRALNDAVCPVIGGRRLIPSDYLPTIQAKLKALRAARKEDEPRD
jgi:hypothetical protein